MLASGLVFGYLAVALALGVAAWRRGRGTVTDYVAGDRGFGPVVMYFVMGATIFSAYALLGTPQRVVAKGSDAFYILAYGSAGFVPMFFFAARVRRLGARLGFVTQAELVGGRYGSRFVTGAMGVATVLAFLPYLVIQLKGAGLAMHAATGMRADLGATMVYAVVVVYVVIGGVRGVGWTNVLQGIGMLVVVWGLGFWIPGRLFGGVGPMFDRVVEQAPGYLTLAGSQADGAPAATTAGQYSSEVLVSMLGFSMWPQVFMKCFTARSARLAQLSAVLYPTFLFFLVPLLFVGFAAALSGGPSDDTVIFWLLQRPELGDTTIVVAVVAVAVLAASMSTGDALLHAGASVLVRDTVVGGLGVGLSEAAQTRIMRMVVVGLAAVAWGFWRIAGGTSVVDLLLLAYAIPILFLPLVLAGLYWRRANGVGARWGLAAGLATVMLLFALQHAAPEVHAAVNPENLQIGVYGAVVVTIVLVVGSLLTPAMPTSHLRRFGFA